MDKENKSPKSRGNIQEELYKMALENVRVIEKQRDVLDEIIKKLVEDSNKSHTDVINHLMKLKEGTQK